MKDKKNLNTEFIPSFTPNIGLCLCINWGAAGVWELISDTRWNDSGEYEMKIHTALGEDYFTAGRWWGLKDLSERFAKTREGYRKQYNDPKWWGVRHYDMSKVKFAKPL